MGNKRECPLKKRRILKKKEGMPQPLFKRDLKSRNYTYIYIGVHDEIGKAPPFGRIQHSSILILSRALAVRSAQAAKASIK